MPRTRSAAAATGCLGGGGQQPNAAAAAAAAAALLLGPPAAATRSRTAAAAAGVSPDPDPDAPTTSSADGGGGGDRRRRPGQQQQPPPPPPPLPDLDTLSPAALAALRGRGLGEHGCRHYRRRCRLVAPCCGGEFWCRHCHNEAKAANEWDPAKRHELERSAVRELVCALCDARQPAAPACVACGAAFGAYACLRCCFFDDDTRKRQFHCDRCGICRVGGVENFFHCGTCGCCYSKSLEDNHVCVENSMRHNCPVCFEYLFDSVRPTAVLPCGHTIHSDCLKEMERHRQLACPTCLRSYADLGAVWRRVDEEVAASPMPPEYAAWVVSILCNDCGGRGAVRFHVLGHKCAGCGSYNTRRLGIDRGDGGGGGGVVEAGGEGGGGGVVEGAGGGGGGGG